MIWPGNVAYLVGNGLLKYGMSRMYEMKASDKDFSVIVVNSVDELPENIKERIIRYSEMLNIS